MYSRPIVPENFKVPLEHKTQEFTLRPLSVKDVIRDFEAVMNSTDHLKGLLDNSGWPIGLTMEENLIDLGWHQREFTLRHSFAYTVLSPNEEECLGCCYIYPSDKPENDVQAFYWIRKERLADGLEERLGIVFTEWLKKDWPFNNIGFPMRK